MVEGAYSEDASFDAHYQDPNATVKEVALEVWAPPGKLGVVIDCYQGIKTDQSQEC
jgi:hypothetical protein